MASDEIVVGDKVRYQHPRRKHGVCVTGTVEHILRPVHRGTIARVRTESGRLTYPYLCKLERVAPSTVTAFDADTHAALLNAGSLGAPTMASLAEQGDWRAVVAQGVAAKKGMVEA